MSSEHQEHESYLTLRTDIAAVAEKNGRSPAEIILVAVSKGVSWPQMQEVYAAGCRDFGENRLPEALEKMEQAPKDIRWHFIGNLQKNKVRKVIGRFAYIHSVDSLELAQKISSCSHEMNLTTHILLQVNTSGEQSKQGLTPEECIAQFDSFEKLSHIKIEGLMTMAPLTEDTKIIHDSFARLRHLRDQLSVKFQLLQLSMGMSHDWQIAIEEGATMLRIGTAIFHSQQWQK